jgi:CheY-like chemotaxis protein
MERTILLIEDNSDDERLTLRALRRNNIMNEVVVAYDGEEGLRRLLTASASELPAVVILDLRLPRLSGLEVLRQIRQSETCGNVPVVVLTASEDHAELRECYRAGANSFVRKPSDNKEFSDVILNLAIYWLLMNDAPGAIAAAIA